jgi:hypothetical protein
MAFDREAWGQALRQHLGDWWSQARATGVRSVYAGLSAAVLWPVIQAVQRGELLPAMVALAGVAGGVGGNLLAEQLQRWKDRVEEPEIATWIEAQATADRDLRAALDSVIERLDAMAVARSLMAADEWREFLVRFEDERRHVDGQAEARDTVYGSGAIAHGPGAVAAGAGSVAVGGNVGGSIHVGPPHLHRGAASRAPDSPGDRTSSPLASGGSPLGSRSSRDTVAVVHGRNEAA